MGTDDKDTWALGRGYERYFGIIIWASNFFKPEARRRLTLGDEPVGETGEDVYLTDVITDNALSFLEDHRLNSKKDPFFIYLAYRAGRPSFF